MVATAVGGTAELAHHGVHALLVKNHDTVALGEAIRSAMMAPELSAQRAAAARQRIEGELSFAARTRRLEAIYEDLVQHRTGVRAVERLSHHA